MPSKRPARACCRIKTCYSENLWASCAPSAPQRARFTRNPAQRLKIFERSSEIDAGEYRLGP